MKNAIRVDHYSSEHRMAVDVKNYELSTSARRRGLVRAIVQQAGRRQPHLPPGTRQSVIIDVRGQRFTTSELEQLRTRIVESASGLLVADNIQFLTDDD